MFMIEHLFNGSHTWDIVAQLFIILFYVYFREELTLLYFAKISMKEQRT